MKIELAIQVCYELNPDNKDREIQGILEAINAYDLKEGFILTHNEEDIMKINGKIINIMPVWKWIKVNPLYLRENQKLP